MSNVAGSSTDAVSNLTIETQQVNGDSFLDLTAVDFERWGILGEPAKKIERLIKKIQEEQPVAVDRTTLICDILIQPFNTVPNQANDLKSLVNAKLIQKLPVSFYEERKFPQFAEYIQTNDDEYGSNLAKHIFCLLTDIFEKQDLDDTSEDMSLGRGMLPIEIDQSSKDQGMTTVGNKRPDFLCWTNNMLLFKGEEKVDAKNFPIAEHELEDKFNKKIGAPKFGAEELIELYLKLRLHENNYVHYDIRLSNIVFVPGVKDYKYVLIDFEHSNISGFSPSEYLKDWDGRTLNNKNNYIA
ncbi:hypothetical protein C1645_814424 [Glomus cerebriforme]|uniref:Uncharacterized protein n=1 Tax=Glomus cerebriforme TaxID=658196 RepID=A0A397TG17_9GLOM|nr:hypothetical protein C1645_814424 [Glomus cerebriforme]